MHIVMHTCACLEFGVQNFLVKSQEIKKNWSCLPHPYYKKKKRTFDAWWARATYLCYMHQVQILLRKKTTFFSSLPSHIIIWKMQKSTNMGGDDSKFCVASLFNAKEKKI
jgi:hypothetical protein